MSPRGAGPPTSGPRHRGRTPGHTTDRLLIAWLHASSRQSTLARGAARGRPAGAHQLHLPLRRRRRTPAAVRRQLNKGQSRHVPRRDLFVAHQDRVRRHLGDQTGQAPCLILVTNAGVPWTTAYPGDAPDQPLRQARNRGPGAQRQRRPGQIPATRPERWYGSRPCRRAGQGRRGVAGGPGHGPRLGGHK